ncbi:Hypothetical protein EHI5A_222230 [Entamoeba histolytica KU27]|uniref:Uncharacterized protein n=1 Tax=Entamoeba histolytica KU27 TaxID=885311 RepID=M2R219_ENTHI|nr:Hypothetical protein EHI5A_222230 [Entamoeba histolytica KU27]
MNKTSAGTLGVISSITVTIGTISQAFGDDITTHGHRPESFIEGIKQGARGYQIVNKQSDNNFEGTMKKMILPFSSVAQIVKLGITGAVAEFDEKSAKRIGQLRIIEENGSIRKDQSIDKFDVWKQKETYICHVNGINDTWIMMEYEDKMLLMLKSFTTVKMKEIQGMTLINKEFIIRTSSNNYSLKVKQCGKQEMRFYKELEENLK